MKKDMAQWVRTCNQCLHTPAYSPALNGIAERENRTLMEKARAMLFTNELQMNRIPNRNETTITPYKQWHGAKLDLGHLRIFGSVAHVHVPHQLRRKLDPTGRRVIFVGYTENNKLFRIFDPNKREVEIVRD
jgi:protein-L-isoaspartate O-methyltransferase